MGTRGQRSTPDIIATEMVEDLQARLVYYTLFSIRPLTIVDASESSASLILALLLPAARFILSGENYKFLDMSHAPFPQ